LKIDENREIKIYRKYSGSAKKMDTGGMDE
jgi:hypothetical protein